MSFLYIPAVAAECSQADCSAGAQSATSNGTITADKPSSNASEMGTFLPLPSGAEISENLFARELPTSIAEWLKSSVPDSPANHSASQATAAAKTTPATCGPRRGTAFARYDPNGSCWKTCPPCDAPPSETKSSSMLPTSTEFSETWPRAGIVCDGTAYPLAPLEPLTRETASGSLPTPTAMPYGSNKSPSAGAKVRPSLEQLAREQRIPTPTSSDATRGATTYSRGNPSLLKAVRERFPTPNTVDAKGGTRLGPGQRQLCHVVRQESLPTPTATCWKNRETSTQNSELQKTIGGTLNPTWVEWLMGWPIGWTDFEPLATDKYRKWLSAHGAS